MPLIPSYIARFRTHSQSTAATSSSGSQSTSTAGTSTPGPEFARLTIDPTATGQIVTGADPTPSQDQIARKIHPDLSTLLQNAAAEGAVEVSGLRPPPAGRGRSAGQLASKRPEAVPEQGMEEDLQQKETQAHAAEVPDAPASPRSPFFARILSTPLLGGVRTPPTTPPADADTEHDPDVAGTHWSTFGRRRFRTSQFGESSSLHRRGSGSKSSLQSKASKRRTQRGSAPVTPSTTRAPSRVQTTSTTNSPPSQSDSPAGTISSSSGSKAYSHHSQSARSKRPIPTHPSPIPDIELHSSSNPQTPVYAPLHPQPASPSAPVPAIVSPRATRPHLDDSPQTFGRVTPKRSIVSSRPHLELDSAFQPPRTSTPPPEHRILRFSREPPSTYPQRSRKRLSQSGSTISFPILPTPTVAHSRPRAEDVFQDDDGDKRPGGRFVLGSNVSGEGDGTGRRVSADWSAAEAVRNAGPGYGENWPATVSREMVRLSLSGRHGQGSAVPVSGASRENVAEAGEAGTLVGNSSKNPTLFGSTGEERRKFFRLGRKTGPGSGTMDSSPSAPKLSMATFSAHLPSEPSGATSKLGANVGIEPRDGGLAPPVSITGPTPSASPSESRTNAMSDPGQGRYKGDHDLNGTISSHGKRKKVESEDEAPPNELGMRSILLSRREDSSHAPSSFRHAKRIRLSTPSHSPPHDHLYRSTSPQHHSPPGSMRSRPPSSLRSFPANAVNPRTLSQSSIPLRAIVSPRPPSIDSHRTYHMRDPALPPPRRRSTQWTGGARKREEEDGRMLPLQGWAFIVGFLVFPLWWVAAAAPVGWGWSRSGRGVQDGKGVWTEEDLAAREVVQYDIAYTWRQRCRFMSLLGLLVYVPLIVLLAILVPRT